MDRAHRSRPELGRRGRSAVTAVAVLVAIEVLGVLALTNRVHHFRPVLTLLGPLFGCSLVLLAMLWRLRTRLSRRALTALLIGGCAVLQLAALAGNPVSSDDDYRYAWDGKVQLSGIDPYRYAPADQALSRLREDFLFPAADPCRHNVVPGGCSVINRPLVRTIYPPVAEASFALVRVLSFGGHGHHLPLQLAAGLGVLATTLLLIRSANRRGSPLWPVAAWALSPLVAIEATNNAHIDWLAALLAVLAMWSLREGRPLPAGLAIGAAFATKLYPGVLMVAVGRRPRRLVTAAAAATGVVALSYLPHVLAVGPKVLGYLPTYLSTESYASGQRYFIATWLVGGSAATKVALLAGVVGLTWLWWRADPRRPEETAVNATGLLLLVATPHYGWYALTLIALIAMSGRIEWLWTAFAPGLQYMSAEFPHWNPEVVKYYSYGIALVWLAVFSTGRRLATRRARPSREPVPASGDQPSPHSATAS
ncbi:DUF2029 domain-containing protein [Jatrophihabitans telluris]|uniref:DUF2029 domain-containing protein n=1 Tax=Jatrophihabitans telluris TaxID=2038343 RepID=A0ABY4QVX1_9ACTN|nr:glycosyltransferase family 87 protein [Jatrophihabitans telluris]UQX87769.1 DUF2029 domain-containing protein [Jatrophihabitans telluris]